jgi:hypothetical protein
MGVKWNNKQQQISEAHFNRNLDLLPGFKEREGHVGVPIEHQESANDNLKSLAGEPTDSTSGWASGIGSEKEARGSRCRVLDNWENHGTQEEEGTTQF